MSIVNQVRLIGNLGRDPEMRITPSGTTVVNFSMATNEKWKDKDGQQQEKTEWHRIVVFGKLADICAKYLFKGKEILIEGKMQTRNWRDRDGKERYTTEVIAEQMKMFGGGDQTRSDTGGGQQPGTDQQYGDYPPDDDIPY